MNKTRKVIYWIATVWLSLGMVSTGVVQLLKGKEGPGALDSMMHLGYPVYFLTLIGISKLLGVVVILLPKFPILKEWAYAGFVFVTAGAIFSHVASGDPMGEIFPSLLLLVLTGISWYLRPESRRVIPSNQ
jgi:uncharacterized membrane protein YphA (DoxX/SURF4 family)